MTLQELPQEVIIGLMSLLGLCVGSFLNVVIYRTPIIMELEDAEKALNLSFPASHCPICKTQLHAKDLVPVISWLYLQGRCRKCNTKISARYPIIELLNATLWALCAFNWALTWTAAFFAIYCSALLALSVIDWDTTFLPDAITLPLIWVGLIGSVLGVTQIDSDQAIIGSALGYSFLWVVTTSFQLVTGKVAMGGGDLKLLAAIGAWLGPASCLAVLFFASILGSIVGIGLKRIKRLKNGDYIPFGPFMAIAAVVCALTGNVWPIL